MSKRKTAGLWKPTAAGQTESNASAMRGEKQSLFEATPSAEIQDNWLFDLNGQRRQHINDPSETVKSHLAMPISLEDALLTVWQQSLIENKKVVTLEDASFPVRSTAKRNLKQIDFQFAGKELRGLEQNPDTKSRWAALARSGKKVMQFLQSGRYLAVVVDGTVHLYPSK